MDEIIFRWTDGNDPDFQRFYRLTEAYYSRIAGGKSKRLAFIPFNASSEIPHVLLAYQEETAAGCAGLKRYSETDAELKRLWVEPAFRGRHIAARLMDQIEEKARQTGFRRLILQTRPLMADAVALYEKRGYVLIPNYPPYDQLDGAVCYAKAL